MDVEQRARELYAAALRANGMDFTAERVNDMAASGAAGSIRATLDAIIAALTPPVGYERTIRDAARYNYLRSRLLDTCMFNDAKELIYCDERNGPELDALIDSEIDGRQEVPDERG